MNTPSLPPTMKFGLWFFAVLSTPVEVFFRHHFGVRYVSPPGVLGAFVAMNAFAFAGAMFMPFGASGQNALVFVFSLFATAVGLYHWYIARRDEINLVEWHTYDTGISYIPGQVGWTQRLIEPAIAFTIGALIVNFTPIGVILMVGAVAAGFKANMIAARMLNQERDIRDAKLMGQHLSSRVSTPQEAAHSRSVAQ